MPGTKEVILSDKNIDLYFKKLLDLNKSKENLFIKMDMKIVKDLLPKNIENWKSLVCQSPHKIIFNNISVNVMKKLAFETFLLPSHYTIESFYLPVLLIGREQGAKEVLIENGKHYSQYKKIQLNKLVIDGKELLLHKHYIFPLEINNYLTPIMAYDLNRYECFSRWLDGVIVINQDKEIIYLNDFACHMFGLSYRGTLRKRPHFYDEIKLDIEDLFCCEHGTLGKYESTFHHEGTFSTKSGKEGYTQAIVTPDFNSFGKRFNWIVFLKDINVEKSLTIKYKTEQEDKEHTLSKLGDTKQKLEKASEDARTDPLTQLYNHGAMKEFLSKELEHAIKYDRTFSLLMFDIDFFKKVNDSYGHQQGDQVLKMFADLIKSKIRSTDFLFRYGGEEFTLILPGVDFEGTKVVSEKLLNAVEAMEIPFLKSKENGIMRITTSIGVTYIDGSNFGNDVELGIRDILGDADKNLYESKETGRNKYILTSFELVK